MDKIYLKPVDTTNIEQILKLKVKDKQQTFVATTCKSLAYVYVNREFANAYGIYSGNDLIGYVSIILNKEDKTYDIWHFFITEIHQGKGYGSKALDTILDMIRKKIPEYISTVTLGVELENHLAIKLYKSRGFVDTGERDEDNEMVMKLELFE